MYQKGTEHDYKVSKLERNEQQIQQLEKSYKERLVEAQNKIATLTHQFQVSKSDHESDKKELEELKEKYAEKAKYKPDEYSSLTIAAQAEAQAQRPLRGAQAEVRRRWTC
jgi:hypothetical protein